LENSSTDRKPYYLWKRLNDLSGAHHGAKELGEGLEEKMRKEMGLK